VNAAHEHLDPQTRNTRGSAACWPWPPTGNRAGTLLEAEIESSRQRQPSTPGFSLLGDGAARRPAIDPRINLNNQPWRLPVVMDGHTGSLRSRSDLAPAGSWWRTRCASDWTATTARLPLRCLRRQDDDLHGATAIAATAASPVLGLRSEGERRTSDALDSRRARAGRDGRLQHHRWSRPAAHALPGALPGQAYNWVGPGASTAA
jgi:iron complex outermembrane receptor protein